MRSPRGFFGAVVFLSLLPVAVLYQMFFAAGVEIAIHLVLAIGAALISLAVFDFKTSWWITWPASAAMGALAVIFFLQALGLAVQNDSLTYFVFQVLGQQLEKLLGLVFILWCIAMLFSDSRGKTKIFGAIVLSAVVCAEAYTYGISILGGTAPEELKLLLLLMFVWLMLESGKKNSG